jgi:hypothetical protein
MILIADRMALDLDHLPLWFFPKAFDLRDGLDPLGDFMKSVGGASFAIVDTGAAFLVPPVLGMRTTTSRPCALPSSCGASQNSRASLPPWP